jgi:hypothetical protein
MKCDMCGETISSDNRYAVLDYYDENLRLYLCCECRKAVVDVINEHYKRYVKLFDDNGERDD